MSKPHRFFCLNLLKFIRKFQKKVLKKHNYVFFLNLNISSININTTQFTPGLYLVVLVCDNNVIESHNLIIQ